jgi:hypothetical protein
VRNLSGGGLRLHAECRRRRHGGIREVQMADVAYLLVTAGGFVLLALILRGLEQM